MSLTGAAPVLLVFGIPVHCEPDCPKSQLRRVRLDMPVSKGALLSLLKAIRLLVLQHALLFGPASQVASRLNPCDSSVPCPFHRVVPMLACCGACSLGFWREIARACLHELARPSPPACDTSCARNDRSTLCTHPFEIHESSPHHSPHYRSSLYRSLQSHRRPRISGQCPSSGPKHCHSRGTPRLRTWSPRYKPGSGV